jgi:hypothetical protein
MEGQRIGLSRFQTLLLCHHVRQESHFACTLDLFGDGALALGTQTRRSARQDFSDFIQITPQIIRALVGHFNFVFA